MGIFQNLKDALLGSPAPGSGWAQQLVAAFETEVLSTPLEWRGGGGRLEQLDAGRRIVACVRADWVELVAVVFHRLKQLQEQERGRVMRSDRPADMQLWRRGWALKDLLTFLLRPRLPFTDEGLAAVIDFYAANIDYLRHLPFRALLRQAKYIEGGPSKRLAASMEALWRAMGHNADANHAATFAQRVLAEAEADGPVLLDSTWSEQVRAMVDGLPEAAQPAARRALALACGARSSSKPSRTLINAARSLIGSEPALAPRMLEWVEAYAPYPNDRDPNEDAIRALIWMLATGEGAVVAAGIGRYCERCFKKIPNLGAPSAKLGNAAIQALALLGGPHAVAELTRLKKRIRYHQAVERIETALTEAAAQLGMSGAELEELAIPSYELSASGERRLPVGDGAAIIRVAGTRDVALTWTRADGRETASVPKALKETAPDAVAAARKLRKEIEDTLAGQAGRLEALYLTDHAIPFDRWRERYLAHPLLAGLTRRLLWRFEVAGQRITGLPRDGAIEDVGGRPIGETQCTAALLWHPLHSSADHVLAWRQRLATLGITQPFKQAHREIYVVTDAERQTDTYSNRFAAHILRQHQFKALCDQRGWRYHLMGPWDSHNTPTRLLSDRRLAVEFWVEGVEGEDRIGVYPFVSTDQVRFVDVQSGEMPVMHVPPLLFSELMRDVDLFVGVASVGNDPQWGDRGPEQFGGYWTRYAFGDLSQSASTRAEVLATLLPSLAIAERCELQDRFLAVRGNLRSYKIHLGSGNILMAPNDQYLCIVPSRGLADRNPGQERLVLPFEGDLMLSVILSKAFLLAADDKITDRSILQQINRR